MPSKVGRKETTISVKHKMKYIEKQCLISVKFLCRNIDILVGKVL